MPLTRKIGHTKSVPQVHSFCGETGGPISKLTSLGLVGFLICWLKRMRRASRIHVLARPWNFRKDSDGHLVTSWS